MAGKRLYTIRQANISQEGFDNTDSFVITNAEDDKRIKISDFIKILRDGSVGLDDDIRFLTSDKYDEILKPESGKYKIENGQIYQLNDDDGQYYTTTVANAQGDTLKWQNQNNGETYKAVSVDEKGVIKHPSNFIRANNLMTADGDNTNLVFVNENGVITKPSNFIKANFAVIEPDVGGGIIGKKYNGTENVKWAIDVDFIAWCKANCLVDYMIMKATDENGATKDVRFRCRIKNGVPQFYGEII